MGKAFPSTALWFMERLLQRLVTGCPSPTPNQDSILALLLISSHPVPRSFVQSSSSAAGNPGGLGTPERKDGEMRKG